MKGWALFRVLGVLLLLFAAVLALAACRVWDNPADPDGVNYQGYHTVESADEVEAHTPQDGEEIVFLVFSVNKVLNAQSHRLQIGSDLDFSETSLVYDKDDFPDRILNAEASLIVGTRYYWRAAAKKDGVWGKWTETWAFMLGGGMSTMNPAAGVSTTDTTPTLSWNAVPNAARYELQIAESLAGLESSPIQSVTDTSYTPSSPLTNEQTHYWRVRAVDGDDQKGAWSAVHSLKVEWGVVSGLNPADGSTTTDTTPTLSWTGVPGAASYEVRIADSPAGLGSASSISVTDSSYTPVSALTNEQTYYWQVRAKDGDDQKGTWSAVHSLKVEWGVVSGLNPADGSTTTDTTPTLSWAGVPGAASCEVRIADSLAGLGSASSISVTGSSYTPASALTNEQTHYWQVRAVDVDGQNGGWSAAHSLVVNIGIVNGLSPADGSTTTDTTPTLSWAGVPGAASCEVRIADSPAGLGSASSISVTGSSYTPSSALTNEQTHYWQVRAVDVDGQNGAWSAAHSLVVNIGIVNGLSPADGSTTTDTTPTLSWTGVPGAANYEVRMADSPAGLGSASSISVTGSSYTPTSALTNLQTHYWQVRAKDGAGQFGAWSNTHSLRVEWGVVSGLNPPDGSTTTDTTPTLSWTGVPGAASCEVRIADSLAGLGSASSISVTGSSYTPTSALTNLQTHYWQVRAVDVDGQNGAWSAAHSLVVNIDIVNGLSPADGSTTTDTTPTLNWTGVPGAASCEVRIADSLAGLGSASSISVTGSSYTPTSALTNLQTHYWQVRAKDGAGQFGAWSNTHSLRVEWGVVSGLNPPDGSTTTDTTPTLSWTGVPGAASHEVRIADSLAGLGSASSISVTGSSYTPTSALTNEQTYYWQVRAKDGDDQKGTWSAVHSLVVNIGIVNDLSPADGSTTTDTTPTLSWAVVPGAASYEVRIADSLAGLGSASSISVTGSSYTPTSALTNEQTYYWQVRAKDGDDQKGTWSAVHSLKVEWGVVSGLNPADGSTAEDTTPTLSWTGVPGAASYEVRIADSLAGLGSASSISITGSSYTPASALTGLQTHYWQVRAKDGAGQFGAWSTVASIRITSSIIGTSGPAGGIIFYDKGSYSDGWRYLEAAPSDQGKVEWGGYTWGGTPTTVGGTDMTIGSGKSNTEKIVTALGTGNYAARLCYDFELGGYDDWFLPSKDELNELYKQKDPVGGFASNRYWSSSEYSSYNAWLQYFGSGSQFDNNKYYDTRVRAVRAF